MPTFELRGTEATGALLFFLNSALLAIAEKLPDCTVNPFGAYDDFIVINVSAKRLNGKAGAKAEVGSEDDSTNS